MTPSWRTPSLIVTSSNQLHFSVTMKPNVVVDKLRCSQKSRPAFAKSKPKPKPAVVR